MSLNVEYLIEKKFCLQYVHFYKNYKQSNWMGMLYRSVTFKD